MLIKEHKLTVSTHFLLSVSNHAIKAKLPGHADMIASLVYNMRLPHKASAHEECIELRVGTTSIISCILI